MPGCDRSPSAFAAPASAQQYPTQDIHFVTGFPPGSGADVITRFFAEKMRVLTGRAVVVENKVGAAGGIAIEYAAKAKPDGYTVLLNAGSAHGRQHASSQEAAGRRDESF